MRPVERSTNAHLTPRAPSTLGALSARVLDLAIPPACAGCASEGEVLCTRCASALDARSGLPPGTPLGLPAALPLPLVQLEWCAPFAGPVRAALHALKYDGERRLAGPLAAAAARRWRAAGRGGDLFVPVPIHAERARRRGYDQAALLAAGISAPLSVPWIVALERRRATPPQFELGRAARQTNVAGAFGIVGGTGRLVAGRWIVLVDDVVTTGATLRACAEPLLLAGAAAVSAIAVARER